MAAVYVRISVPEVDAEGRCKQLEAPIQRCFDIAQLGLASNQITVAAGSIKRVLAIQRKYECSSWHVFYN